MKIRLGSRQFSDLDRDADQTHGSALLIAFHLSPLAIQAGRTVRVENADFAREQAFRIRKGVPYVGEETFSVLGVNGVYHGIEIAMGSAGGHKVERFRIQAAHLVFQNVPVEADHPRGVQREAQTDFVAPRPYERSGVSLGSAEAALSDVMAGDRVTPHSQPVDIGQQRPGNWLIGVFRLECGESG